jgi:hypothetical protein
LFTVRRRVTGQPRSTSGIKTVPPPRGILAVRSEPASRICRRPARTLATPTRTATHRAGDVRTERQEETMRITRWATVILSAITLGTSACARNATFASGNATEDPDAMSGPVSVTVRNNNFSDMTIYAIVDNGLPMRLGSVSALSSGTFKVRHATFPLATLSLVASEFAGRGVASSGTLHVAGGQSALFTIQSNPATSYGSVH